MTDEPRPTSEGFQQPKSSTRTWKEELNIAGNQLADEAKRLVHEGNVRTLRIKHNGKVLVEVPVTAAAGVGAVTVLVAPQIAILGAIAGVLTHCTLEIEHTGEPPSSQRLQ